MSEILTINDSVFDKQVSLRDAYKIMLRYLEENYHRGEQSTGSLLGDISLHKDNASRDPAALYDYLDAAKSVIGT